MAKLECALVDSLIKPLAEPPVLSIVVPSWNRADELVQTVQCLNDQLTGGLEAKVEIIISDNGSGQGAVEAIRAMGEAYGPVNYMLNARDEGGFFNLFAAPWRARGAYTWTFGSDDLLADGGIANVVATLEREQPGFMTLNKRVVNAGLTEALIDTMNIVESRPFDNFTDMFCAFGINQFAFLSGQIEHTETARQVDAAPYLRMHTRHAHLPYYLAKHHGRPAYYLADNHLMHRNDNSPILEYHAGNFFDFGVTLPCALLNTFREIGVSQGLLEQVNGEKRVTSYQPPKLTFVDAMFENQLRAMAFGRFMTTDHKWIIEDMLTHCRADRQLQFDQIWMYSQHLESLERTKVKAEQAVAVAKQKALQTSAMFTQPTAD